MLQTQRRHPAGGFNVWALQPCPCGADKILMTQSFRFHRNREKKCSGRSATKLGDDQQASCISPDEMRRHIFPTHVCELANTGRNYGFNRKHNLLTSSWEQPLLSLTRFPPEPSPAHQTGEFQSDGFDKRTIKLFRYFVSLCMTTGIDPSSALSQPIAAFASAVTLIQTNGRITLILDVVLLTQSLFSSLSMVLNEELK